MTRTPARASEQISVNLWMILDWRYWGVKIPFADPVIIRNIWWGDHEVRKKTIRLVKRRLQWAIVKVLEGALPALGGTIAGFAGERLWRWFFGP